VSYQTERESFEAAEEIVDIIKADGVVFPEQVLALLVNLLARPEYREADGFLGIRRQQAPRGWYSLEPTVDTKGRYWYEVDDAGRGKDVEIDLIPDLTGDILQQSGRHGDILIHSQLWKWYKDVWE
jgi:hypothetical protein